MGEKGSLPQTSDRRVEGTSGRSGSDEEWVTLQKAVNDRYLSSYKAVLLDHWDADQMSRDIRRADMTFLIKCLHRSYARRSDTWMWSLATFSLSSPILVAVTGLDLGIMFAMLTCLGWTVVHRVRTL